jgi:ubiquitin carboxyl-terminal hydrolase 10
LEHISDPQAVKVSAESQPEVTIEASHQVLVEELPPILVIHLKRFLYDTDVGSVIKIGRQIRVDPELVVGSGGFTSEEISFIVRTFSPHAEIG